ncbi:MAG: DUF1450 domain-containing protein [Clostridia bacterium]
MDKPIIHFCENNFGFGTDALASDLENDTFEIEIEQCMGHCGECAEGPIAVIGDELITADDIEELDAKIRESANND